MKKIATFITLLLTLSLMSPALFALPKGETGKTQIFIEPFLNTGTNPGPTWLSGTLLTVVETQLKIDENYLIYKTKAIPQENLERPFRLQRHLSKDVFGESALIDGIAFLLRGRYYVENNMVHLSLNLYDVHTMNLQNKIEISQPINGIYGLKTNLVNWVKVQLGAEIELSDMTDSSVKAMAPATKDIKPYWDNTEGKKKNKVMALQELWNTIMWDPYRVEIFDIQTRRDVYSPDSIYIDFQVKYAINPRIIDALEQFAIEQESAKEGELHFFFSDMDYVDPVFYENLKSGMWRKYPVVSVGENTYAKQRKMVDGPAILMTYGSPQYSRYSGIFTQLLIGLPGVRSIQILANNHGITKAYSLKIGRDEMSKLNAINVKFYQENDLYAFFNKRER
jgi:hypothetical protein